MAKAPALAAALILAAALALVIHWAPWAPASALAHCGAHASACETASPPAAPSPLSARPAALTPTLATAPAPARKATASARRALTPATVLLSVRPGSQVALRSAPNGAPLLSLGALDEFHQRTVLSVLRTRGGWGAVSDAQLGNGHLGWVRLSDPGLARGATFWSVLVKRSAHRLLVRYGEQTRASFTVGVGASDTPTPLGRFAVTDKLPGPRYSPVYGCCILALSALQPRPPSGWQGQARMAIHGTDEPQSIGANMSAGCVHADDADMRWLMAHIPAGTPVSIER